MDVILAADASPFCLYHACRITQRWEEIPHSFRPQHAMAHGDSFHVTVRNAPAQPFQQASSSSGAASSTDPLPNRTSLMPQVLPEHHNRFMTPLHLYQFQGHEVVTHLVNAQLVQPSHDIANALNVPFDALEAFTQCVCVRLTTQS